LAFVIATHHRYVAGFLAGALADALFDLVLSLREIDGVALVEGEGCADGLERDSEISEEFDFAEALGWILGEECGSQ
jgi:hypothetical protein